MITFHVIVCTCGVTFRAFLPRDVVRPPAIFCPFCCSLRPVIWHE